MEAKNTIPYVMPHQLRNKVEKLFSVSLTSWLADWGSILKVCRDHDSQKFNFNLKH